MTPERWQQVKDICYAALDCPEARSALLLTLCRGDADLQRDVERAKAWSREPAEALKSTS